MDSRISSLLIVIIIIISSSKSPVHQHSDIYSLFLTSPFIQRPVQSVQNPLQ